MLFLFGELPPRIFLWVDYFYIRAIAAPGAIAYGELMVAMGTGAVTTPPGSSVPSYKLVLCKFP